MSDDKRPVVVGYDGSTEGDQAVDWAAHEAARLDAQLVVLLATDTSDLERAGDMVGRGHSPRIEEQARAVAEAGAARARAAAPGLSVQARTTSLGPAAGLQDASTSARLVVVGRRGRARVSEALLGTVHFAVTAHADCSVVVVPPEGDVAAGLTRPVAVGLDGSDGSTLGLRAAAEAAAGRRTDLVVVCAWLPRASWSPVSRSDDRASLEEADRAKRAAVEIMDRAKEVLDAEFPDVARKEVVAEGRPSTLLARESLHAGLVVIGARGRGDLSTLRLGSVGRNLIYRAECPVAIIR